jgi:NCS1 family nucleobase:cation symporter-1
MSGRGDEVIAHADGRVELRDHDEIERSPLYNHDLAPVRVAARTWGTWDFAALWVSMAHCIPTYMLAGGLINAGMSWAQALFTILLGNLIILAPILLNSHPGTKYGIPFPVFARAAYGTVGSNVPALMRAVIACGWFGINAWIGGAAVHTFLRTVLPGYHDALGGFLDHTTTEWISFLLFWGLNIFVIFRGMELLRKVERWSAPFVMVMAAALVWWAIDRAHGLGPIMSSGGDLDTFAKFFPVLIPSLTGIIGFWATLSLNMPDFTRFGRSQKEQMIGQVVALPTTMTIFSAMAVLITSASMVIYHEKLWDPNQLVGHFESPWIKAAATFTIVIATLSLNIAANVVSPANDFANAFPSKIDFKRGGLITGVLGIVMQPWRLLADPSGYIFDWLGGYAGALASVAGVLVVDYWILRRRELSLPDLYRKDGCYTYDRGWHWPAIIATVVGTLVALVGRWWAPLAELHRYGWFAGFGVAAVFYYALGRRSAVR